MWSAGQLSDSDRLCYSMASLNQSSQSCEVRFQAWPCVYVPQLESSRSANLIQLNRNIEPPPLSRSVHPEKTRPIVKQKIQTTTVVYHIHIRNARQMYQKLKRRFRMIRAFARLCKILGVGASPTISNFFVSWKVQYFYFQSLLRLRPAAMPYFLIEFLGGIIPKF